MDDLKPAYQRWYDRHRTLAKSVRLLETFPNEIQDVLGETMVSLANRHSQSDDLMADLKSLGPDKVLAIFKSKNKRRTHDANNAVHRGLNYMLLLPEEGRVAVAEHVIRLVNVIVDYLKVCRLLQMPALPEDVGGIAAAYMEGGPERATEYLHMVRPRPLMPTPTEGEQRLAQDRRGLKIRQDQE